MELEQAQKGRRTAKRTTRKRGRCAATTTSYDDVVTNGSNVGATTLTCPEQTKTKKKEEEEEGPSKRRRRVPASDDDEGKQEAGEGKKQRNGASADAGSSWSLLDALDDDSALGVLQILSQEGHFATILNLRTINVRWCGLASADYLWRPRFVRAFGPVPYERKDAKEAARADRPIKKQAYYPSEDEDEDGEDDGRYLEDKPNPILEYDDESDDESDNTADLAKKKGKAKNSKGTEQNRNQAVKESKTKTKACKKESTTSWFQRYAAACRCLPVAVEVPHLTEEFDNFLEEWCQNNEEHMDNSPVYTSRFQFSAAKLMHQSDSKRVPYRMHRLAVILAILHNESHVPEARDMVRIGYSQKNCTITLARFCYAYIHGKEMKLLEELDLLSPPPPSPPSQTNKHKKKKTKHDDSDDSDEDSTDQPVEKRYGWRQDVEPALGLNIDGEFVPFVYFHAGIYGHRVSLSEWSESRLVLLDFMSHNQAAFGSSEEFDPNAYCFRTPKKGWAPGFFNASFSWFKHAALSTVYNRKRKQIIVIKATEKEMVW